MTDICLATSEDLRYLETVERSASRKYHIHFGTPPTGTEPTTPSAILVRAQNESCLWLAKENAAIVGFLAANAYAESLHIEEVSVVLDRQGRGLGKKLMDAATTEAVQRRCRTITLTTDREIPWTYPFYKKRGFAETELADCPAYLQEILRRDKGKSPRPDSRVAMICNVAG